MSEREALLAKIHETPGDDALRLVFANWLHEHGEQALAEFIRVQLALARIAAGAPTAVDLRRRERELLAAHRASWIGDLTRVAPVDTWQFRRGFPDTVNLEGHRIGDQGVATLAESSLLSSASTLNLSNNRISVAGAKSLAVSTHLANLTILDLSYNQIGDRGVAALAVSKHLAKLTTLILADNGISAAGAAALAASPYMARLTTLNLGNNRIGDRGLTAIAGSPHLARLTTLNLGHDRTTVDLENNRISELLAASTLGLWSPQIGNEGVAALVASPFLTNLTALDLAGNMIGDTGAAALVASPHLAHLTALNLVDNRISAAGARTARRFPPTIEERVPMSKNEAFIRRIVDNPGDDTPRLVYADWLDDGGDPRGPYMRVELELFNLPPSARKFTTTKMAKMVRKLQPSLDPVWVARVSRPPIGVCLPRRLLENVGPQLSVEEVEAAGSGYGRLPRFPPEYKAFLLNYNGGSLVSDADNSDWSLSGFAGLASQRSQGGGRIRCNNDR